VRSAGDQARPAIRAALPPDRAWIVDVLVQAWGSTVIESGEVEHEADRLPALVAVMGGERVGLATYRVAGESCELVTLNALVARVGVGSTLLSGVAAAAREAGCRRLWLATSNDNLDAMRFYQRRGMRLVGLDAGAIDRHRVRKPEIPLVGHHGIPIRDELHFELLL
jgi:GNAT superfamily N-acetyltransferase